MSVSLAKPALTARPVVTVANFAPAVAIVDIAKPEPVYFELSPAAAQVEELRAMARVYRTNAKARTVGRALARREKSARQFLALAFA